MLKTNGERLVREGCKYATNLPTVANIYMVPFVYQAWLCLPVGCMGKLRYRDALNSEKARLGI